MQTYMITKCARRKKAKKNSMRKISVFKNKDENLG